MVINIIFKIIIGLIIFTVIVNGLSILNFMFSRFENIFLAIELNKMTVEQRCKAGYHKFNTKRRFGTKTCMDCNKQIEFKKDGKQVCWRSGKYDFS